MAGGMQDAGFGIRHMGLNGHQLQMVGEAHGSLLAPLGAKAEYAAGALRHIFLCQRIIFVSRKTCIIDPGHLGMVLQEGGYLLGILAMTSHPQMEAFQSYISQEGILGGLTGSQIPHQLCHSLLDKGHLAESLGIDNAMIGIIRGRQTGEFVCMSLPVEVAGIYDGTSYGHGVPIHIFGGGMGYNVHPPLKGLAIDRSSEGIVTD